MMLLRKVSEHIRTQNWLAVILDFLIVVFGVFVGIQVDNWNQARIEANSEKEYLQLIDRDLNRDIEALDDVRFGIRNNVVGAQRILDAVAGENISAVEIEKAFTWLYLTFKYTPQQSTYLGLRSGAELDILQDSALRSMTIDYYEIHQNRFGGEFMADYEVAQRLLHAHFSEYVRFLGPDPADRTWPLPDDPHWTELIAPLSSATGDVAFLNDLSEFAGRGREILGVIEDVASENEALQNAIRDHMSD